MPQKQEEVKKPVKEQQGVKQEVNKDSDRTKKEFDKLKQHNQELKDKAKNLESVVDSLEPKPYQQQPQPQPQQQAQTQQPQPPSAQQYSHLSQDDVNKIANEWMDENGYINVIKMNKALNDQNIAAQRAIGESQRTRQELEGVKAKLNFFDQQQKSIMVKKTHDKYPQVDPQSKEFDSDFYDLVRSEMIGQMTRGQRDFLGAAKKVAKNYRFKSEEDKTTPEDKKKGEAVDQINATAGTNKRFDRGSDHKELVKGTMKGDRGAIAERLRRAGY
jgi:hypothetical protein